MLPDYTVLHFSTILPGPAFRRFTRRIESRGVQVVFDLEDTHWDPDDPVRTAERKSTARRLLLDLAAGEPAGGKTPLTVRVNGLRTKEFPEDLALLGELASRRPLRCVVLPKVEDADMVGMFLELSAQVGAPCPEVIPLIETGRGVQNLGSILTDLRKRFGAGPVRRVMYGAFDHCLDTGRWPFWEQVSGEFWEFLEGFVERVEGGGFSYVHTPIDAIADKGFFRQVIARLRTVCHRPYVVSSLVEMQILAALEPLTGVPALVPRRLAVTAQEAHARARRVVSAYAQRKRLDAGFVIDARLGRFISPHEVVAARAYLEADPDDRS
jgi:citrate lyase beta subunit